MENSTLLKREEFKSGSAIEVWVASNPIKMALVARISVLKNELEFLQEAVHIVDREAINDYVKTHPEYARKPGPKDFKNFEDVVKKREAKRVRASKRVKK